ncbi:MAG: hypothetical protein ISP84_01100 [Candidatus Poseidonia sp.]|jgi:fructose-specific phosphotransferase system component IIB|nr:hypothetical protein [Poseidonia sp.]
MTEEHVMDVRWSGEHDMAHALKEAAEEQGHDVTMETLNGQASLRISVTDHDLQSLRDRVDALLVVLGDVEEHHNG